MKQYVGPGPDAAESEEARRLPENTRPWLAHLACQDSNYEPNGMMSPIIKIINRHLLLQVTVDSQIKCLAVRPSMCAST